MKKAYIITREITTYEYNKHTACKNIVLVENTIINSTVYGTRDEARAHLCELFKKDVPQFVDKDGNLTGINDVWMIAGGPKKTETGETLQDTIYKIEELALSDGIINQYFAIA